MIRVIVSGALGAMGQLVADRVNRAEDMEIAACIDIRGGEGILTSLSDFTGEKKLVEILKSRGNAEFVFDILLHIHDLLAALFGGQ